MTNQIADSSSSYGSTAPAFATPGRKRIEFRAHWNSIKDYPGAADGNRHGKGLVLDATQLNGNIMEGTGEYAVLATEVEAYRVMRRTDANGSVKRPIIGERLSEAAARQLWNLTSGDGVKAGDLTGNVGDWRAEVTELVS